MWSIETFTFEFESNMVLCLIVNILKTCVRCCALPFFERFFFRLRMQKHIEGDLLRDFFADVLHLSRSLMDSYPHYFAQICIHVLYALFRFWKILLIATACDFLFVDTFIVCMALAIATDGHF